MGLYKHTKRRIETRLFRALIQHLNLVHLTESKQKQTIDQTLMAEVNRIVDQFIKAPINERHVYAMYLDGLAFFGEVTERSSPKRNWLATIIDWLLKRKHRYFMVKMILHHQQISSLE